MESWNSIDVEQKTLKNKNFGRRIKIPIEKLFAEVKS